MDSGESGPIPPLIEISQRRKHRVKVVSVRPPSVRVRIVRYQPLRRCRREQAPIGGDEDRRVEPGGGQTRRVIERRGELQSVEGPERMGEEHILGAPDERRVEFDDGIVLDHMAIEQSSRRGNVGGLKLPFAQEPSQTRHDFYLSNPRHDQLVVAA